MSRATFPSLFMLFWGSMYLGLKCELGFLICLTFVQFSVCFELMTHTHTHTLTSSVGLQVDLQTALLIEEPPANLAAIRLLARVDPHVPLEVSAALKDLAAERADKALLGLGRLKGGVPPCPVRLPRHAVEVCRHPRLTERPRRRISRQRSGVVTRTSVRFHRHVKGP